MPLADRFDTYGDVDVLRVDDVERPAPGAGQALVRVRAAGINPGETAIRQAGCTTAGPRRSRPDRAATSPA